ncbi:hypothetical protein OBDJBBDK_00124 [Aeromonas phage AhFM11]|nr:hypothetical protein OBDJBBDK_00124 [Aeromonas phage AhFM11]
MARSDELVQKAKELQKLLAEVDALAAEHDYGMEINGNEVDFNDWLSSSCYGEGSEAFGIHADGSVWMESNC